ncbi:MAG: thymidine kinase [Candidatus Aenigmarchaeota archaeon]|nr:thymidine kinase [Candidatus Aenigmarchaeota archaeon]
MEEFGRHGCIEVIAGPMFSGKSEELIRRMKRVQISGKNFRIFKPTLDARYDPSRVVSHDQRILEATAMGNDRVALEQLEQTIKTMAEFVEVIAFDEGNFFDPYLTTLAEHWATEGRRVIVAGLDMDFRGNPFGPMPDLLAKADYVDKLKAICMKCKQQPAVMSQRIVNGHPARPDDPLILVGAFESYEARCRTCHTI